MSDHKKSASLVTIDLQQLIQLKASARGFSFLPRQPVQSLLAGRHASRLRGRGLAFEEVRHYNQGDDVRTIDWKATARLRSPHVRVYSEERERPVLLVVDQRCTMFFGSRRTMKSVAAAELCALAAWKTLSSGDRVGGIVFNDHQIINLKPQRSQTAVLRLLHEVTLMNQMLAAAPDTRPANVSLNQALQAAARRAVHDFLVVVISDLHGANQQTQQIATQLAAHNDVLIVAVYDPLGAALQGKPGMIASTDHGLCTLPTDRAFAAAFRQQFSDRLNQWRQIFQGLKVPVLPISTVQPAAQQLRELFGRRHPLT